MTELSEDELDARHAEKMKKRRAARDKILATKTEERGLIMVHTGKGTLVQLRRGPAAEVGFDLRFLADDQISVACVGDDTLEAHHALDEDAEQLRELEQELLALVVPLSRERVRIAKVNLDGVALKDMPSPDKVAIKIIHSIALLAQQLPANL